MKNKVEQLDDRNEYQPESQVKTDISDRALILLPFYCLFRQMTMETIDSQQDGSLPDSVAESESAHMQMQTGQNSVPTLAQVNST